jgi:hypothetical protein
MSSDNGGIIGVVNDPTSTTASGVWQQEEQYEAKVNDTWPQRPLFTTKSLRFNDGSSDSLNRTPSGDGNKRTFTFSTWLKISTIKEHMFFTCGVYSSTSLMQFYLNANGTLTMSQENSSGSIQSTLTTTQVFRDTSAWYHFVIAIDTTQGTDSNRVKLYVNGSQVTSFSTSTYPSQNLDFACNTSSVINTIGNRSGGSFYFDGYMAEIILVDGSQLAPTSFGSTNSDGVWIPSIYTGTFGTNGFNLQFEDSSSLGTDSSANGNNFTVNNLTSIDQSTDYPVVNFATWNPLENYYQSNTYSEGNLQVQTQNTSFTYNFATIGVSTGKWYWEVEYDAKSGGTDQPMIGITSTQPTANDNELGNFPNDFAWYTDNGTGYLSNNNTYSNVGFTAYTVGDVISVALDLDNNKLYFAKNGTWEKSGNPESGSTGTGAISITATASTPLGAYFPSVGDATNSYNATFKTNFGSPPYSISSGNADGNGYGNFEYAVPSGYYSLNTANLAEFG